MNFFFGKNINYEFGAYGNAVLSRFPIRQQTHTLLQKLNPFLEQRGVNRLIIDLCGTELVLMNTHLDHTDDAERLYSIAQLKTMSQAYGSRPLLLCGDFNATPGSSPYAAMAGDFIDAWTVAGQGNGYTFPSANPNRRIDYYWCKPGTGLHPPAQYSTGFENPPFVSGNLNGQDSWTSTTGTPASAVRIRTATEMASDLAALGLNPANPVHGGSQALLVSATNLAGTTTLRPVSGLQSKPKVVLNLWARPLSGGLTGNVFLVMEDNAATPLRTAAFRFGLALSIEYATSTEANSFFWQPSGLLWNPDNWYELTMSADYGTKTYDFSINGARINTSPIPFYDRNSANFSQIRIFRGSSQTGMIVDDLRVTAVLNPLESWVPQSNGSDHLPLVLESLVPAE